MSVMLNQEAEKFRLKGRKLTWEYFSTQNYEEAIHKAKEMGWKDRNVQVRIVTNGEEVTYQIEPFERDCSCPSILKYTKAFPD